jgi:hypothetical protein
VDLLDCSRCNGVDQLAQEVAVFQGVLEVVAFELLIGHFLDPHLSLLTSKLEVESGEICPQLRSNCCLDFLTRLTHTSRLLLVVRLVVCVVVMRVVVRCVRVVMRRMRVVVRMAVRVGMVMRMGVIMCVSVVMRVAMVMGLGLGYVISAKRHARSVTEQGNWLTR